MTHFLEVDDLTPARVRRGARRRARSGSASRRRYRKLLDGRGAALLFEKPSARTRASTEMAVVGLGGHPIYIRPDEVGLGVREPVADVARTPRGLLRGHRGAGVRPRDARRHGRRRSTCRWSTCCPTARTRARRSPTSSRCASCSATSKAAGSCSWATATTSPRRWPSPPRSPASSSRSRRRRATSSTTTPSNGRATSAAPSSSPSTPTKRCRAPTPCTPTCGRRWARKRSRRSGGRRSRATRSTRRS